MERLYEIDCGPYVDLNEGMNHGGVWCVLDGDVHLCDMTILIRALLCDKMTPLQVQMNR